MPFFLISVILIVMTVGAMQYTKQGFHVCLTANLCAMVLVPYVFGLAGHLLWGVYALRGLLLLDGFFCIFHLTRVAQNKGKWNIPMWSCLLLILALTGVWWVTRGRMFTGWEEFEYWGAACKFTVLNDMLPTASAFANDFRFYPPGQVLLQYSLFKIIGLSYREDVAIFVSALPMLCAAMYAAGFLDRRKHKISALAAAVLLTLAPVVLETNAYTEMLMDMRVGALAALLILIAVLPEPRVVRMILLGLAASVLVLYKPVGVPVCILVLLGCGYYMATEKPGEKKASPEVEGLGKMASAFLPFLLVAVSWYSWHYYLSVHGIASRWKVIISPRTLFGLFRERGGEFFGSVLSDAGRLFFTQPYYGGDVQFAPVVWVLAGAVIVGLAAALCNKKQRNAVLVGGGVSLLLYVLYLPGMLYTYMFVMEEYYGWSMIDFYRFLDTPLTVLLIVCFALAVWVAAENWKNVISLGIPVLCLLLIGNAAQAKGFLEIARAPSAAAAQTQADRADTLRTARYIRKLGQSPRVQLIMENDGGWAKKMLEYELGPDIVLPPQETALTAWMWEEPGWYPINPADLGRQLQDSFDFLYIQHMPEESWAQDFAVLFEDPAQVGDNQMYMVVPQDNGQAKLRRMMVTEMSGQYVSPPLFTWQVPLP